MLVRCRKPRPPIAAVARKWFVKAGCVISVPHELATDGPMKQGRDAQPPKTDRYAEAGVDIAAGNAFVEAIKPFVVATRRPGVLGSIGGFGGLFDLKAAGFEDPLLVACTDGVGTKILLARELGQYSGIGTDLVAMCVNDLVVQGAKPLFFLDYFATGKLETSVAVEIVQSITEACRATDCALLGGETAEMPGVYPPGEFDLAGFAIGAVERGRLLPRDDIKAGDMLIGLPSSGPHSNGFSLIRKIVAAHNLPLDQPAPFDPTRKLGDALLTPTRLYVKQALAAAETGTVKAMAHITGGGLIENLPRVLPDDTTAAIDLGSFAPSAVFQWLGQSGALSLEDMFRTFNAGIGFVFVTPAGDRHDVISVLENHGETPIVIGAIRRGHGPATTIFDNLDDPEGAWQRCVSAS